MALCDFHRCSREGRILERKGRGQVGIAEEGESMVGITVGGAHPLCLSHRGRPRPAGDDGWDCAWWMNENLEDSGAYSARRRDASKNRRGLFLHAPDVRARAAVSAVPVVRHRRSHRSHRPSGSHTLSHSFAQIRARSAYTRYSRTSPAFPRPLTQHKQITIGPVGVGQRAGALPRRPAPSPPPPASSGQCLVSHRRRLCDRPRLAARLCALLR